MKQLNQTLALFDRRSDRIAVRLLKLVRGSKNYGITFIVNNGLTVEDPWITLRKAIKIRIENRLRKPAPAPIQIISKPSDPHVEDYW